MTVIRMPGWCNEPSTDSKQLSKQRRERSHYPAKGLQVAATLFALRIGYRAAKIAVGRLFPEQKEAVTDKDTKRDESRHQHVTLEAESTAVAAAADQWIVSKQPAPVVPDGFKLVASEHLPITVYRFYEQFLSAETTCLQDHHKSNGQYDFRSSSWKPVGDGSFSRQFDFMQPKKGMCTVNAHCLQQQCFTVHPGGIFVMSTDMHMEHIPYADCFRVQSFWKAEPDATGLGTNVSIYVAVPFVKRCLMKGIISSTTMADCRTFFGDFLSKVQNSIVNELLPSAAAAAAASEQLLAGSQMGLLPARQQQQNVSPLASPFADADAQVFINSQNGRQAHAGTSSKSKGSASSSGKLHLHQQQHRSPQKAMKVLQRQQQQPTTGAQMESLLSISRVVSAKPSFAQPISDARWAGRSSHYEVLTGVQAILLLLVLVVQLLTLYDNMELHKQLAAATAASSC